MAASALDEDEREDEDGGREPSATREWAGRLADGAWDSFGEKWVPEPLRGARMNPGRRGAALVIIVAAIAAVVAAVGVWWVRPEPTPVPARSVAGTLPGGADAPSAVVSPTSDDHAAGAPGGAPAGANSASARSGGPGDGAADAPGAPSVAGPTAVAADATASASGPILVSVTGNVRSPGVVTVPADARVADAIAAAGGALDATDLTGLNLAQHVSDGSSIVVGGQGANAVVSEEAPTAAGSGPAGAADDVVHLNTASAEQLQTLSGVGPVTAQAIIEYRTQHGPFTDIGQLEDVSGIGPATFARLSPHVAL